MATAYGYCRVSTGKQGTLGLDAQANIIRQLWETRLKKDYPDLLMYEEQSVSAYSIDFRSRPKAKEIGLRIARGDCIVVAKLDRAFRSIRDTLNTIHYWRQIGVKVYCPDFGSDADCDSLHGKIMLIGLSLAAEIEGDRVRQRMSDWKESQKKMGRATAGHAPYGFKFVRHGAPVGYKKIPPAILQPDDKEQAMIRWMYEQKKRGFGALVTARHLNEKGFTRRNGKPFDRMSVQKILNGFIPVILAEIALEKTRRMKLRPWEFISDQGVLCQRLDIPPEEQKNGD